MLNIAQRLLQSFFALGYEDDVGAAFRAPHTPVGTPPRKHIARKNRFALAWTDAGDVILMRRARLFKGHRV